VKLLHVPRPQEKAFIMSEEVPFSGGVNPGGSVTIHRSRLRFGGQANSILFFERSPLQPD
jgi:hypothetical protein